MVICFNLPLVGSYARDILSGVLSAAKSFPELSLWLPHAQIQQVVPTKVDGVIRATHAKGLAGLPRTVPIINVNSGIRPGTWQVCTDNDAVGQLAFDHFMERNIRSFAVFRIKTKSPPWARLEAFERCVIASGFPIKSFVLDDATFPLDALRTSPKPTGILFQSDPFAAKFTRACKRAGIDIPGRFSIVSVNNNVRLCTGCTPQLSSIDLSAEEIGRNALQLLVKIIQGDAVPQVPLLVTPQELVARESSARFIRKDEDLESALTYMTDHIAEPIVFDDILAQQTLGARALEMRFKDRFGVPPMRYLRDLRLERVKHLLESTDIKVIEIGRRCGMPNANHLCALFKKRYHKTPLQYRKSC